MMVTATGMANVILYGSFTMWLVMPYLTEVWDLSIMRAAAIVNIFDGAVAILPLGFKIMLHSVANKMGADYWMLLVSGLTSTLGLGLVTMSTPPVLAKATKTCSTYEIKCIGNTQKSLFYTGLILLGIGMSTCLTSVRPYILERAKRIGIRKPEEMWTVRQALVQNHPYPRVNWASGIDSKALRNRAYQWPSEYWLYRSNGTAFIALLVLVFWVLPWPFRFGVPVIILGMATFLFTIKPWYRVTDTDDEMTTTDEQTNGRVALSLIKEIVKLMMKNVYIWPTFVIGGVVSSVGNTYFIEQAGQMNPMLGKWNVAPPLLIIFYKLVNIISTKIYQPKIESKHSIYTTPECGIAFALLSSVICCISAAVVEMSRLVAVEKHGLFDQTDETVPLSMFALIPQFFFLGVFDGLNNCCIYAFFQARGPKGYANSLMHLVVGLGMFCNVLSVFVAGKISDRGGEKSWFQHTLNKSRLDYYYWVLAILSAINLVYYGLVVLYYRREYEFEKLQLLQESDENVEELEHTRLDWFDLLPLRQ